LAEGRAHRDTDVGEGERRRVVNAVSGHATARSSGRPRTARTTSSFCSGAWSAYTRSTPNCSPIASYALARGLLEEGA
jgi:hypothetical protein